MGWIFQAGWKIQAKKERKGKERQLPARWSLLNPRGGGGEAFGGEEGRKERREKEEERLIWGGGTKIIGGGGRVWRVRWMVLCGGQGKSGA